MQVMASASMPAAACAANGSAPNPAMVETAIVDVANPRRVSAVAQMDWHISFPSAGPARKTAAGLPDMGSGYSDGDFAPVGFGAGRKRPGACPWPHLHAPPLDRAHPLF